MLELHRATRWPPPILGSPSLSLPNVSSHFQRLQRLCLPQVLPGQAVYLGPIFAAHLWGISEIRGRAAAPTSLIQRDDLQSHLSLEPDMS